MKMIKKEQKKKYKEMRMNSVRETASVEPNSVYVYQPQQN